MSVEGWKSNPGINKNFGYTLRVKPLKTILTERALLGNYGLAFRAPCSGLNLPIQAHASLL